MAEKYRLVTRSDFDGLVCAMILKEMDLIDDIKFVHPKDMQDGLIPVTNRDITTNLPYVEGVLLKRRLRPVSYMNIMAEKRSCRVFQKRLWRRLTNPILHSLIWMIF